MWSYAGHGKLGSIYSIASVLHGVGEEFDNVRQQILVMDPTPIANEAYYMVASVEKQRQVHMLGSENVTMHTRTEYKKDFPRIEMITVREQGIREKLVSSSMETKKFLQ
ncbi:UNVERIFIED_CONTAM: hypothetical protein Scaly_0472700 [Sesamum calycinum]|uniref:Uncharacterized protein n=1 Tax=Sesamum calycinum TaxID=2727403 RepID=A0AAW2SHQ2_9LAMI